MKKIYNITEGIRTQFCSDTFLFSSFICTFPNYTQQLR